MFVADPSNTTTGGGGGVPWGQIISGVGQVVSGILNKDNQQPAPAPSPSDQFGQLIQGDNKMLLIVVAIAALFLLRK